LILVDTTARSSRSAPSAARATCRNSTKVHWRSCGGAGGMAHAVRFQVCSRSRSKQRAVRVG
jgi:hypothetical protein